MGVDVVILRVEHRADVHMFIQALKTRVLRVRSESSLHAWKSSIPKILFLKPIDGRR